MRLFYQLGYRYFRMPWEMGPRPELVALIKSGRITPCRAIDLGCGTGSNVVFLAQRGFDVTGVDYASSAIEKARRKADAEGVRPSLVVDDLTRLKKVSGPFDFLVDYGTFDDLTPRQRAGYLRSVLPLTRPGSRFLLWCFEWRPRWWERAIISVSFFGAMALEPGEAQRRFQDHFDIERLTGASDLPGWPRGWAAYLMTRRE